MIPHYHYLTGGWWFNNCAGAHLTGPHTETRSADGDRILYYFGGERLGQSFSELGLGSWESWAEAKMLLLPN